MEVGLQGHGPNSMNVYNATQGSNGPFLGASGEETMWEGSWGSRPATSFFNHQPLFGPSPCLFLLGAKVNQTISSQRGDAHSL